MGGRAPGLDLESAGKETARAQYRVNSERTQRAGARCIQHRDPSARPDTELRALVQRAPRTHTCADRRR